MKNKMYETFDLAVKDIPDGATIMVLSFTGAGGIAQNLLMALSKQGARDLTVITANTGLAGGIQKRPGLRPWVTPNILIEHNQVKKVIGCAASASLSHRMPGDVASCEEAVLAGKVEWEPVGLGVLADRLYAGAAGMGGYYSPVGIGTVMERGKERRTINGKDYLFETPLRADFALIRAHKADPLGNLVYRGSMRNANPLMARAARVVIAEVDKIVEIGELDPESVVTPGVWVDRIVLRREGDW